MLTLKLFLTIAVLQILPTAAPIAPRQTGPFTLVPVMGSGTGILNTSSGSLDSGIYTEYQGQLIGGELEQELEELYAEFEGGKAEFEEEE